MGYVTRIVWGLALLAAVLGDPTLAQKQPTLDDALAVRSTGAISVIPDGKLIAIEAEGGIMVLTTDAVARKVKILNGSSPAWSPDGKMLGFYAEIDGKRQLQIWHRATDTVEQITEMPEGISPNPFYYMGDTLSFVWSHDSTRIAFCSRRMPNFEALGSAQPPKVKVFRGKDAWDIRVLDGVFKTDFWDSYYPSNPEFDPMRMRAAEADPRMGLNRLFAVDIRNRITTQLSREGQYFYPSWSPDDSEVAAVVDLDNAIEFPGPLHTALAILDSTTGLEQRVTTPMPINGQPLWFADGQHLALAAQSRQIDSMRIELYDAPENRWSFVSVPHDLVPLTLMLTSDGNSLLVRTWDRFVYSLWIIHPTTGRSEQVNTGDRDLTSFAHAKTGDVFFVARASTYTGRVYKRPQMAAAPLLLLYDPNPQFVGMEFAAQRRVTWTNKAGDSVDGIVIFPPHYDPHERYPVLIDVYPWPAKDTLKLSARPRMLGQIEADMGYVVFLPGLRSPHSPGWYSRDAAYNDKARGAPGIPILLDDFTSGVKYLEDEGIADPDRIGIYGHSNGGWVVNYLITETHLARCAVISEGASDVIYEQYFSAPGGWVDSITNGSIYDNLDEFVKMSPILRMNQVQTPLLMIVGDKDWNTWLPEMLMEFNALRQLGKEVTLVRYADEGHAFDKPEDIRDSLDRIHAFFEKYLKSDSAPQGPSSHEIH